MKYKFIRDQQNLMSVKHMCTVLQVSRSAYYSWQQATISARETQNQELVERITEIHQRSHRTYGSPRIWHALRQQGIRCSRKRIARLMHIHDIRAKMVRRFKVTTRSRSTQVVAPDLVQRQFMIHQPNRVWTSDITYIWTREGWVYLAVVLDLCSRMIVGWEVSSRLTAVERALSWRRPDEDLILHSDRGSQYASSK
jgi:putative transposase